MANDQGEHRQSQQPETGDRQLQGLISLFNWLVGEVITARLMVLRLAGDLVRTGVLSVEEINGTPLTEEIIDSVMSNFPADPMWQGLGRRLRDSLTALRNMDLHNEAMSEDDDDDDDDDDGDDLDLDADEIALRAEGTAQVIYSNPDHQAGPAEAPIFPRVSRIPGGNQN